MKRIHPSTVVKVIDKKAYESLELCGDHLTGFSLQLITGLGWLGATRA